MEQWQPDVQINVFGKKRLVAGTQLTENGVKELEDLEKVVKTELDTRLSKQQAA